MIHRWMLKCLLPGSKDGDLGLPKCQDPLLGLADVIQRNEMLDVCTRLAAGAARTLSSRALKPNQGLHSLIWVRFIPLAIACPQTPTRQMGYFTHSWGFDSWAPGRVHMSHGTACVGSKPLLSPCILAWGLA